MNEFIIKNNINAKVYSFESILRLVFTKNKVKNRIQRDFFEKKIYNEFDKFKKFVFKNRIYYPSNGILFLSDQTTKKECKYIISIFKKGLIRFFKNK